MVVVETVVVVASSGFLEQRGGLVSAEAIDEPIYCRMLFSFVFSISRELETTQSLLFAAEKVSKIPVLRSVMLGLQLNPICQPVIVWSSLSEWDDMRL